jgi:protein MpaA
VQKLGKNLGRYLGETIDVPSLLGQIAQAGESHGWTKELIGEIGSFPVVAWHRQAVGPTETSRRIYISAGIHGDEPASPLAALRLLQENRWPANVETFLVPCLNPVGFTLNQRENGEGIDLNRDYRNPRTPECLAHIAWLERQPNFECYFCLHEDWESQGFYLYEQNPDGKPSLAEAIMDSVKQVCPIDGSENIEGRPAQGGIIRPVIMPQDRPDWPEALYLIRHKSRLGYTLEAPSDFPFPTRVNALVAAIWTSLQLLTAENITRSKINEQTA